MHDFTVREYAFISVAYEGCPTSSLDHAYIPKKAFEHLCDLLLLFPSMAQESLNLQDVER